MGEGQRTESDDSRADALAADATYTFEDYEFEAGVRRLSHRGTPLALEPKVAGFLGLMLARAGDVVSRDELRHALWPEGSGNDSTLNYVVSRARQALAQFSRPAVVLCRGRGYRLDVQPTRTVHQDERVGLIERRSELGQLHRVWSYCAANQTCRLVLVTGAAGVGKTALVQQFLRDKSRAGHRVAWGHCLNAKGTPAFLPWRVILGELCPGGLGPSAEDVFASFTAAWASLARIRSEVPLVIVIEDLHLADERSLDFLEFVQVHFTRTPLLLIGTCVTPVLSGRKAQLDAVARCARLIELGPLSAAGAKRLLRRVRSEPLAPSVEHQVLTLASGNPSVVVGAARALGAAATELDVGTLLRSPSALCNGVRHLLSGLQPTTKALLPVAAAMGMDFDVQVLALVLGVEISLVAQRLSSAVELEVVRPCSETEYRFAQLLFREYLYRAIPDEKRRDLHWKIGTAMRQLRYEETAHGLTRIAFHLSEGALSERQASEAAQILQRAGDSELRNAAPDSAAASYAEAMRLARRGGWSSEKRVRMALLAGRGLREAGATEQATRFTEYAEEIMRAQEGSVILGRAADVLSLAGRSSSDALQQPE